MLLEPGAAEIVAIRKKNKGSETIRQLLEETKKCFDAGKSIRDLNVEFHLALAKLSYNPLLILTLLSER